MPTCPSCHRDQVQSSAFCAFCGAVLDRPASAPSPEPSGATPSSGPSAGERSTRSADTSAPATSVGATTLGERAATRKNLTAQTTTARAAEPHDFGDVGAYIVRRLLALALDVLYVGALIAVAARAWTTRNAPGSSLGVNEFLQLAAITGAGLFAYRWLFEGIAGTTLGKLVFGLDVRSRNGERAGLGRAFVRNLLLPLDLAVIGFLLAAVTPRRRRLGDLLAGTIVSNSRIGALAPIFGIAILAAATYGINLYAGGLTTAQRLAHDATNLAPVLVGASPAPAPVGASPTPTPAPSPAATIAPSPVPTTASSPAPSKVSTTSTLTSTSSTPAPTASPRPEGAPTATPSALRTKLPSSKSSSPTPPPPTTT